MELKSVRTEKCKIQKSLQYIHEYRDLEGMVVGCLSDIPAAVRFRYNLKLSLWYNQQFPLCPHVSSHTKHAASETMVSI
jgi:hypothetical protein